MANNKAKFNVTGKSVTDLVNLTATDIRNMNRADLGRVVTRLSSAANKRLRRFEKAGFSSPATRAAMKKGYFSGRGLSRKELISEYKRVKSFLTAETGTIKGYKKFLKNVSKAYKKQGVTVAGGSEDAGELQAALDEQTRIYEWLKEKNPQIDENRMKYGTYKDIADMMQASKSELAIKRRLNKMLKEEYEREQEQNRNKDIEEFFQLPGNNEEF